MTPLSPEQHHRMSAAITALSMDAVQAANSGHPGMPMGMADAATVLFGEFLKFDPADPDWPDRDRFVLSAGHGSMLIYALLHLVGVEDVSLDQIRDFRQLGSNTAGHPEYGHTPGVETTTGPLGQGIANAVGCAIAERHLNAHYGDDLVDHRTYVIAGDGCLMEGISQEAIALAGHLALDRLIVLWDDNNISIDGSIELSDSTDQIARFKASKWNTLSVDGHDPAAVRDALRAAQTSDRPTLIACKTTIARHAPTKAGTSKAHGAPLGPDEIAGVREALDWHHTPFEIPDDVYALWSRVGERGAGAHAKWAARADGTDFRAEMENPLLRRQGDYREAIQAFAARMADERPSLATRASSGQALGVLTEALPAMIGGSADLEGSNKTKTPALGSDIQAGAYGGRYINYGIREHGMAAAMNGMALHGGIIPYSGTFLVFADYCRPAIRLSALMGVRVIYVMTHDSIGVGEDGPTHQPVEHLASLRAIPDLDVYRPADAVEVAECWQLAVESERPSVLALTRQSVPTLRRSATENRSRRGGYALVATDDPDIILIGTGSETQLAVEAASTLSEQGVSARVVSMPCLERYRRCGDPALVQGAPVVVVEAGVRQGWDALIGGNGGFVGMNGFGASAPGAALFSHFGITTDAVVASALDSLSREDKTR